MIVSAPQLLQCAGAFIQITRSPTFSGGSASLVKVPASGSVAGSAGIVWSVDASVAGAGAGSLGMSALSVGAQAAGSAAGVVTSSVESAADAVKADGVVGTGFRWGAASEFVGVTTGSLRQLLLALSTTSEGPSQPTMTPGVSSAQTLMLGRMIGATCHRRRLR